MVAVAARRGVVTGRPFAAVAACVALAALSLVLPATLTFDQWSWLVWGREILDLDLDTTGGPSWKPLPVAFTTLFAPFGDLAPDLWMVTARAATLLALVATYRLAFRFSGRLAGAGAAALLVLTPDRDPRFLRLFGEGHVAPASVALVLFAIDRHLDGRHRHALLLGTGAGLLRPEIWPFLGLYALWLWRVRPGARTIVVAALGSLPVLWFGFDWLGSGSPWHGADAAQVSAEVAALTRLTDGLSVVAWMVVPPAWALAAVALRRRSEGDGDHLVLRALAAAALAWCGLVVSMAAALGYAALSRFMLPGAALVCVLAGVGLVRVVAAVRHDPAWRRWAVVALVAGVAVSVPRAAGMPSLLEEMDERAAAEDDLDRVLGALDRGTLLACGDLAVEAAGLLRPAVAWKLDLPLHEVPTDLADGTGVMLVRTGGARDQSISRQPHTDVVLRSVEWSALAVRCPSAALHS